MPPISKLLAGYRKLQPLPTGVTPQLNRHQDPPVRLILFDVYGTLLVSASGDIDQVELTPEKLIAAAAPFKLPFPVDRDFFAFVMEKYRHTVTAAWQAQRSDTRPYPEIDILAIWSQLLEELYAEGRLTALPDPDEQRRIAMVFELCTNPVTPMPGMKETLAALRAAGIELGIVSNAQFYTPVILHYFLNGTWSDRPELDAWFDPELCVFSYRERRAKPDRKLFDRVSRVIAVRNIPAAETLFVGNDVRKDLIPAAAAGFGSVLFAGDARSLRLYRDDPAVAAFRPDYTITALEQLQKVCQL
ncbi:MAG: HAD family hydrolase [Victivallales bacterium]|nr:HAD family hydrolase [Victivallales bacterium]